MFEGDASDTTRNLWLSALARKDYALIGPHLSRKELAQGAVLYDAGQDVDRVFFPEKGVVSLLTVMEDGDAVETAAVGPEGLVGAACGPLTSPAPARAVVQAAGAFAHIDADRFAAALRQSPSLRAALGRFSEALFAQVQQSAACNARHRLEERLARWLLTFQDRIGGDDLPITQDQLSGMLGVRRATVSEVGATLETRRMIRRARGRITVLDRPALEHTACECYAAVRSVMDGALGRVPRG